MGAGSLSEQIYQSFEGDPCVVTLDSHGSYGCRCPSLPNLKLYIFLLNYVIKLNGVSIVEVGGGGANGARYGY
jgi:hypothetical protein